MTKHALRALGVACGAALIGAAPAPAQTCEPYWTRAGITTSWNFSLVVFDDGSGPALYRAGVHLPEPSGTHAWWPVQRLRGPAWESLWQGIPQNIYPSADRLIVLDDGNGPRLYLTGLLAPIAPYIRRWNGQLWEHVNPLLVNTSLPGGGFARISYDDGAGPAIYGYSGQYGERIVRWTGDSWTTIGQTTPNPSLVHWQVFDDGTGPALYIQGTFSWVSGILTRDIIRWNGQQWSAVGGGIRLRADRDICVYDGSLYVIDMYMGGGKPINGLGRWDGASWSNAGAGFTSKGFLELYSMEVFDDGTGPALFVAGLFEDAGGVPTRNLAKWDGQQWHAVPPGMGYIVNDMAVYDDGRGESLFLGGDFVSAGGGLGRGLVQYVGCKTGNCYADCNRDGALTIADFTCFQAKFAAFDPYANCNKDAFGPPAGVYGINISDFGCFMTKYALGCP